jgi:lipopolysaccharide export system permease protein
MYIIADSLNKIKNISLSGLQKESSKYLLLNPNNPFSSVQMPVVKIHNLDIVYSRALEKIRTSKNIILSSFRSEESVQEQANSYMVEIHKKYALPVACIVFILIGAPLGVMVRKGGFGVAASISLFFFVIYWAFLIGGEKLADRNIITPFWGMWSANILLCIAGITLTTKTIQETIIINFNFLKKLLPRQWRNLSPNNEEVQS